MSSLIELVTERNQAHKDKNYQKVIDICNIIIKQYPREVLSDTYAVKGIALFNQQSYQPSLDILLFAHQSDKITLSIPICCHQLNNDTQAIRYFEKVWDFSDTRIKNYAKQASIIIWLKQNNINAILNKLDIRI